MGFAHLHSSSMAPRDMRRTRMLVTCMHQAGPAVTLL